MGRPTKYCREEMLDKATALFWEKGYRGVSIMDLVNETGVLAGSIYGCFGSKDGIFLECIRHYAEKSTATLEQAAEAATPLQQIEALFDRVLEIALADDNRRGCFVVNALLEIAPDRPEISKALHACTQEMEQWLKTRIEAAQACGQLPDRVNTDELTICLSGVVLGIQMKTRGGESHERIRSYTRAMLDALLAPARSGAV